MVKLLEIIPQDYRDADTGKLIKADDKAEFKVTAEVEKLNNSKVTGCNLILKPIPNEDNPVKIFLKYSEREQGITIKLEREKVTPANAVKLSCTYDEDKDTVIINPINKGKLTVAYPKTLYDIEVKGLLKALYYICQDIGADGYDSQFNKDSKLISLDNITVNVADFEKIKDYNIILTKKGYYAVTKTLCNWVNTADGGNGNVWVFGNRNNNYKQASKSII